MMITDALATELWIWALCCAVDPGAVVRIGPSMIAEVTAWRFAGRPRA